MGLAGQLGLGDMFSGFSFGTILTGVGLLILAVITFLIIGGAFFVWFYLKKKKELYKEKLFWFEDVKDKLWPIDEDMAAELIIPGTNVHVFYIKKKDMYMPRLVKKMGKNSYWLGIKNNREIVNFDLGKLNKDKTCEVEYDHTDMRYAHTNLRDLIKRNYRDKSTPWWREYKETISLAIIILFLTIFFAVILWQGLKLADKMGTLIERASDLIKAAEAVRGSGVTPA